MFAKKEREVFGLIRRHFDLVEQCVLELQNMFRDYLHLDKDFKEEAYRIHQLEHEADGVRREVEQKLYEGAFLPVHREDFIRLVELNDNVANTAESVGDFFVLTRPMIPDFLKDDLEGMLAATLQTYEPMPGLVDLYQEDRTRVREIARQVGEREQKVDELQWETTKKLFKSDLDLAWKLHLRELVEAIGSLSDIMEDACDCLQGMVVKGTY